MKALIILIIIIIPGALLFAEYDQTIIVENLIVYDEIASLKVNDLYATEELESLVNDETSWIKYSIGKTEKQYYLTGKNVFQIPWSYLEASIKEISSSDLKYEVIFISALDDKEHYIIGTTIAGLESVFNDYYEENYTYYNGVYYPEHCKSYYKKLMVKKESAYTSLFKKVKDMEFYSYFIARGMFSDPQSREEPSFSGLPPEMAKTLKEMLTTNYPIKGYWYDLYISGVILKYGMYYWGFVLRYQDEKLQESDYDIIKKHLYEWISLRKGSYRIDTFVELGEADLSSLPGLTFSKYKFRRNTPKDFWFKDPLNRSYYF